MLVSDTPALQHRSIGYLSNELLAPRNAAGTEPWLRRAISVYDTASAWWVAVGRRPARTTPKSVRAPTIASSH